MVYVDAQVYREKVYWYIVYVHWYIAYVEGVLVYVEGVDGICRRRICRRCIRFIGRRFIGICISISKIGDGILVHSIRTAVLRIRRRCIGIGRRCRR